MLSVSPFFGPRPFLASLFQASLFLASLFLASQWAR